MVLVHEPRRLLADLMLYWQPAWLMGKKTRGPDWIELMETVMDRRLLHYASMGCDVFIWVSAWRAVSSAAAQGAAAQSLDTEARMVGFGHLQMPETLKFTP